MRQRRRRTDSPGKRLGAEAVLGDEGPVKTAPITRGWSCVFGGAMEVAAMAMAPQSGTGSSGRRQNYLPRQGRR
jgi:hypothetical protein